MRYLLRLWSMQRHVLRCRLWLGTMYGEMRRMGDPLRLLSHMWMHMSAFLVCAVLIMCYLMHSLWGPDVVVWRG